jgi:hypothetical protein
MGNIGMLELELQSPAESPDTDSAGMNESAVDIKQDESNAAAPAAGSARPGRRRRMRGS